MLKKGNEEELGQLYTLLQSLHTACFRLSADAVSTIGLLLLLFPAPLLSVDRCGER